jgi:hypothetical protein
MAKIDIGNKEFSKAINNLPYTPNRGIIKKLDAKLFSLDANNVYSYKPEYLAGQEFKSVCDLFQRRFGDEVKPSDVLLKVMGLFEYISRKEKPFIADLQNIAVEIIRDLYDVPEHVDLKAFIEPRIHLDTEQDNNPEPFLDLSLEQKNAMRDEIQKRVILNGLVHGSSMHIWKGVYYLVKDKLDEMNPQLVELYDEFTAGINFQFWMMNPDGIQSAIAGGSQLTQGFNKLTFDQPGKPQATVLCKAINFPALLHEVNKGVIDYLICHSIPKHYSKEELAYYYSKADAYENEIWHYLLSPTLWSDLLATADVDSQEIPKIIMNLSKLSYQTLTEIFRIMMTDQKAARIKLQVWKVI